MEENLRELFHFHLSLNIYGKIKDSWFWNQWSLISCGHVYVIYVKALCDFNSFFGPRTLNKKTVLNDGTCEKN